MGGSMKKTVLTFSFLLLILLSSCTETNEKIEDSFISDGYEIVELTDFMLQNSTLELLTYDISQEQTPYTASCYRKSGKGQVYILEFERSEDLTTIMDGDNSLSNFYDLLFWYDLTLTEDCIRENFLLIPEPQAITSEDIMNISQEMIDLFNK